jgi:GNAT superfamily N-acetyltransferase
VACWRLCGGGHRPGKEVEVDVEIGKFDRGEESQAVELLIQRVPPDERPAVYERRIRRWRWQYYENPNNPGGEPSIWVARMGSKVTGLAGTVPVRLITPRGKVQALWALDLVVDPSMRGRGIGKRMMTEVVNAAPVALGIGWSPAGLRVDLSVGLRLVHGFTGGNLVVSPFRFEAWCLRNKHYRYMLRLGRDLLRLGRWTSRSGTEPVTVSTDFPPGTARLWERVSAAYDFAVDRDAAYLEWRYKSHPTYSYRIVYTGTAEDPRALAVYRLTDDHPPAGVLLDLIVDPRRQEEVTGFVNAVAGALRSDGAYAAGIDLPPALAPTVRRGPVLTAFRPLSILVKPNDPAMEKAGIESPEAWYISYSDSDQDY